MKNDHLQAAVFLDRDGTINEEVGHLVCLEKLKLIRGAAEAIRLINESGMKSVVVTNQSGIGRGIIEETLVDQAHARLREMLGESGAFLDGIYFCPHHPTEGRGVYLQNCICRKPLPGLLLQAAEELSIDPKRSTMIGDTLNDIRAGAKAGMRGILVRTGFGADAADQLDSAEEPRKNGDMMPHRVPIEKADAQGEVVVRPVYIAADLLDAVRWLLRTPKP